MTILSTKPLLRAAAILAAAFAIAASAQDIRMDWTYHAAEGLSPAAIPSPFPGDPFLVAPARPDAPAIVHVLTPRDFAGPLREQVCVRWWDGRMAHWITGNWVKNVTRDDCAGAPFADQLPPDTQFDLWRVEIPTWILQPGDNYYAIQLKATGAGDPVERYLLARGGGDFSRTNALGQVWSSSEEFDGQDWPVSVPAR